MHPAHAPETLALVQGPPRPAPSSGTHGAPRHSVAPRVSLSHTLARTQAGQETLGSEAEASLLSLPNNVGRRLDPSWGGTREGNGWEQVPGPVPAPGEGLPGPQALLVPCRPGCPLPLLHAAPEGRGAHKSSARGESRGRAPGRLLGPWPSPDQLERPPPTGGGSGSEGPEMEDWATTAEPGGGWGAGREAIKDRDICSLSRSKYRVD